MRAVLPGKPRAKLLAVCTGYWDDLRLIVSYCTAFSPLDLLPNEHIGVYHWKCLCDTYWSGFHTPDHIRRR
jgi:hypothetical protein